MRATRAYLASLGTTGILLASTLLVLGVVGGIVGFEGWPGEDRDQAARGESFVVADSPPATAGARAERAPERRSRPARRARPRRRATAPPRRRSARRSERRRERTPEPRRERPPRPAPPSEIAPTEPRDPGGGGEPRRRTPVDELAEGTREATGQLGGTIGRVDEDLGEAVTETGDAAADLIGSLDDGLPATTAAVGTTLRRTGDAVGGLVRGTLGR